ncbi:hypothetical protein [Actinoplanes auranticolor]|uniref:Lipoprotein n=1 Tax=Actinoplanes auranticolor TaxID=47988 RepID=A0A919VU44_9ACTN|nr:hypothetical protein [Actinoplanes auranticolor]GIM69598.1 hypothetical protein Aau02nite_36850 [Actinoplanes auranticolor]
MPRSLSAFTLCVLIAGSLLAAGTVVGCSSPSAEPVPAPLASPSPAPAASAAPVDEPPGAIACDKAVRAVSEASLMNPGVVADITAASGTADAPVADAAQTLSTAYTRAVAAHGTDAEPDAVAAVSAAAAELVAICGDSGLETVG